MRSLLEQMGSTYTQQSDYYLLPPEEERPISVWGQRRLRYLQEHRPILYPNQKTSGQRCSNLSDVEKQANELFLRLVKDYADSKGITEQLKTQESMKWVRRMNNIRVREREIINNDLIYT